jgi:hypothetical protein
MTKRNLLLGVLTSIFLTVTACSGLQGEHGSGSIAMAPFVSEEYGIRGLAPQEGWTDRALLAQMSFPGTMDELVTEITADTDLIALPRSIGTYRGSAFTWDLFKFNTQIKDQGSAIYRVELALAQSESAIYLVYLVTQPTDYAANTALYKTVYIHALYALTPIE